MIRRIISTLINMLPQHPCDRSTDYVVDVVVVVVALTISLGAVQPMHQVSAGDVNERANAQRNKQFICVCAYVCVYV